MEATEWGSKPPLPPWSPKQDPTPSNAIPPVPSHIKVVQPVAAPVPSSEDALMAKLLRASGLDSDEEEDDEANDAELEYGLLSRHTAGASKVLVVEKTTMHGLPPIREEPDEEAAAAIDAEAEAAAMRAAASTAISVAPAASASPSPPPAASSVLQARAQLKYAGGKPLALASKASAPSAESATPFGVTLKPRAPAPTTPPVEAVEAATPFGVTLKPAPPRAAAPPVAALAAALAALAPRATSVPTPPSAAPVVTPTVAAAAPPSFFAAAATSSAPPAAAPASSHVAASNHMDGDALPKLSIVDRMEHDAKMHAAVVLEKVARGRHTRQEVRGRWRSAFSKTKGTKERNVSGAAARAKVAAAAAVAAELAQQEAAVRAKEAVALAAAAAAEAAAEAEAEAEEEAERAQEESQRRARALAAEKAAEAKAAVARVEAAATEARQREKGAMEAEEMTRPPPVAIPVSPSDAPPSPQLSPVLSARLRDLGGGGASPRMFSPPARPLSPMADGHTDARTERMPFRGGPTGGHVHAGAIGYVQPSPRMWKVAGHAATPPPAPPPIVRATVTKTPTLPMRAAEQVERDVVGEGEREEQYTPRGQTKIPKFTARARALFFEQFNSGAKWVGWRKSITAPRSAPPLTARDPLANVPDYAKGYGRPLMQGWDTMPGLTTPPSSARGVRPMSEHAKPSVVPSLPRMSPALSSAPEPIPFIIAMPAATEPPSAASLVSTPALPKPPASLPAAALPAAALPVAALPAATADAAPAALPTAESLDRPAYSWERAPPAPVSASLHPSAAPAPSPSASTPRGSKLVTLSRATPTPALELRPARSLDSPPSPDDALALMLEARFDLDVEDDERAMHERMRGDIRGAFAAVDTVMNSWRAAVEDGQRELITEVVHHDDDTDC